MYLVIVLSRIWSYESGLHMYRFSALVKRDQQNAEAFNPHTEEKPYIG
jgi:hypothetical protein